MRGRTGGPSASLRDRQLEDGRAVLGRGAAGVLQVPRVDGDRSSDEGRVLLFNLGGPPLQRSAPRRRPPPGTMSASASNLAAADVAQGRAQDLTAGCRDRRGVVAAWWPPGTSR